MKCTLEIGFICFSLESVVVSFCQKCSLFFQNLCVLVRTKKYFVSSRRTNKKKTNLHLSSPLSKMTTPNIAEESHHLIETSKVQMFTPKVVAADLASAIVVGATVAIPISIIDFAIMVKVAGLAPSNMHTVKRGIETLFKRPYNFFIKDPADKSSHFTRVYHLCASVYITTYIAANVQRSYSEGKEKDPAPESVALKCGISSSAVNIVGTVWKDTNILLVLRMLEQKAGKTLSGAPYVPWLSRFGFALRDFCTCVAAFTIVPLFREYLKENQDLSHQRAQTVSSLFTPCSIQLATTAIHIPSIIYQRQYNPTKKWAGPEGYLQAIGQALRTDYTGALRMRVMRIFAAFGIGGLGNAELRPRLLRAFEPQVFMVKKSAVAGADVQAK